jgi:hypothetical protein
MQLACNNQLLCELNLKDTWTKRWGGCADSTVCLGAARGRRHFIVGRSITRCFVRQTSIFLMVCQSFWQAVLHTFVELKSSVKGGNSWINWAKNSLSFFSIWLICWCNCNPTVCPQFQALWLGIISDIRKSDNKSYDRDCCAGDLGRRK